MKQRMLVCLLLATLNFGLTNTTQAAVAQRVDSNIGSSLVEPAACRVVRQRVTRPDGRIVFRATRTCAPTCRLVRRAITLPNGHVVIRQVRVCR